MPRKTKDSENKEIEVKNIKAKRGSKSTTAKETASTEKLAKTKSKKKSTSVASKTKTATTKKTSSTKKVSAPKVAKSKKTTTVKKSNVKKKTTAKKTSTKKIDIVEYYDLPYRYNQTIVKVLAQTPTSLFIYWDISDEDRENYKKNYGENFFETTKPVLKIYNETMNYEFEIEINDFANSWYLHVNDSKCNYKIELGRRPINLQNKIPVDYIYISSSNKIESPNDKILINKLEHMVYFRNVKTQTTTSKSIANLSFMRNMGKIYNIYDLYKKIYKDEDIEEINNPSSRFF